MLLVLLVLIDCRRLNDLGGNVAASSGTVAVVVAVVVVVVVASCAAACAVDAAKRACTLIQVPLGPPSIVCGWRVRVCKVRAQCQWWYMHEHVDCNMEIKIRGGKEKKK